MKNSRISLLKFIWWLFSLSLWLAGVPSFSHMAANAWSANRRLTLIFIKHPVEDWKKTKVLTPPEMAKSVYAQLNPGCLLSPKRKFKKHQMNFFFLKQQVWLEWRAAGKVSFGAGLYSYNRCVEKRWQSFDTSRCVRSGASFVTADVFISSFDYQRATQPRKKSDHWICFFLFPPLFFLFEKINIFKSKISDWMVGCWHWKKKKKIIMIIK